MTALVGQFLGQYQIIGFLGEGGIGRVYRARRVTEKHDVAIKIIKPNAVNLSDLVKSLKREALVSASLHHPNILNVISYGQQETTVYVVMPLLTGGNLADLVCQKDLSLSDINQILDQVASALDYIHARGIVHRDVKLENVLLDETGCPFLADFGMTKSLSSASKHLGGRIFDSSYSTKKGLVIGTPSYMSPEQCRSKEVDARSDVYSLGIVLYELLTGELPFEDESSVEVMFMHISKQPPRVSSIRPNLPAALDAIVGKALAKNPEDRFQSAGALAVAFRNALNQGIVVPTSSGMIEIDPTDILKLPVKQLRLANHPSGSSNDYLSFVRLAFNLFLALVVVAITALTVTVLLDILN